MYVILQILLHMALGIFFSEDQFSSVIEKVVTGHNAAHFPAHT